jgi:ribosomal protein S25
MPRVSNTVDQARTLLERRLRELDDERKQVEAALAGLGKSARRAVGRPRTTSGRRRRRRGSTRADQAVKIITENPGITVSELGKKMKLNHPNYLYRVLPDLQKEGRIKRRGKGYRAG